MAGSPASRLSKALRRPRHPEDDQRLSRDVKWRSGHIHSRQIGGSSPSWSFLPTPFVLRTKIHLEKRRRFSRSRWIISSARTLARRQAVGTRRPAVVYPTGHIYNSYNSAGPRQRWRFFYLKP